MRPPEHLIADARTAARPSTRERHIDALTRTLEEPNAQTRRGAAEALGGMGLNTDPRGAALACRLSDADTHTRVHTAYALLRGGMPKAPSAMEQAKRLVTSDPRNRQGCVEALTCMGEAGAAALAGVLDHPNCNAEIRRMVAQALGSMGADAFSQVGVLSRRIGDDDAWVRTHTAESLLMMGTAFSPRLGDLRKSLDDGTTLDSSTGISQQGQAVTRRRALQAMGQRGAFAAPYASEIASYLQDSDQGVRRRAAESLARIGVSGESEALSPHGRALAKCLQDNNAFVRSSALGALCEMGPASEGYALELAHACRDSDPKVRSRAAEGLGHIGPAASHYILDLASLLRDMDAECRRCGAVAMLQMGMAAAPYAKQLAQLLDDDAAGLRWTLADGLKSLGRPGAEALSSRLKDSNSMVRQTARTSLQQMGWQITEESPGASRSPRTFQYRDRTDGGNVPSHVQMRIRAPDGILGQGASPRLYRRPPR